MNSTATVYMKYGKNHIIDLTDLGVQGSFYSLDKEQMEELARDYYRFVVTRLGKSCVQGWRFDNHTIKDFDTALLQRKQPSFDMLFWAYFSSDYVYNKTTMRELSQYRNIDYSPYLYDSGKSVDWQEYYDTKVSPLVKDAGLFRNALLDLFNLEGKTFSGIVQLGDMSGLFWTSKTPFSPLFHGHFGISIKEFVLDGEVDAWAEVLCDFCRTLTEKYANVNAGVYSNSEMLTDEPYTLYYGRFPETGLGRPFDLCLRHHYLTEVNWGQYLSAKTRQLGSAVPKELEEEILLEELKGGGCFLRPKTPVSQVRIADLRAMKHCLYPTILPRKQTAPNMWKYRSRWEKVPVFAKELLVEDNRVIFQHHGTIDAERVCRDLYIDYEELTDKRPESLIPSAPQRQ